MNIKIRLKNPTIDSICHYIIFILVMYLNWYKEIWGGNQLILYSLAGLVSLFVLGESFKKGKLNLSYAPLFIKTNVLFILYSAVTGFFVSEDLYFMIESLITYAAFIVICFFCCYTSKSTKGMYWLLNVFKICACVCSIQTVFWGKPYYNGIYVTTMSTQNNPNSLGLVLLIGIFALLYDREYVHNNFFTSITLLIMFLYSIILSGSRKIFLAAVILVLFFILSLIITEKKISIKSLINYIALFGCILIVILIGIDYIVDTSLFRRLLNLKLETTDSIRVELYHEAFQMWKQNPVFGVGYNQFRILSRFKFYSHSTYAEILSCGGLVGIIIYFIPLFKSTGYVLKLALSRNVLLSEKYKACMITIMLIIELLLGFGQIFMYSFNHLLFLTYISWSITQLEKNGLEKTNS